MVGLLCCVMLWTFLQDMCLWAVWVNAMTALYDWIQLDANNWREMKKYMFDGFIGKSSQVLPGLLIVMSVHLISVKVTMTAKDLVRRCWLQLFCTAVIQLSKQCYRERNPLSKRKKLKHRNTPHKYRYLSTLLSGFISSIQMLEGWKKNNNWSSALLASKILLTEQHCR